jgi:putative ABC transport system permease protein
MESLIRDIRYGARVLARRSGLVFVAITTLALGIGANTAVFSVVNSVLLNPLTYKDPDRLVRVYEKRLQLGRTRNVASAPDFLDWRAQNQVFDRMAAWTGWGANLTGEGGEPERISGALVTADLFPLLGVEPLHGRTFLPEEDGPGDRGYVVVISHGLWQRRFGGDPSIVGSTVTLNTRSLTVVGVMPPGFQFPTAEAEIWVPLGLNPADPGNRGSHFLDVVARLKPGVTLEQAQAEMDAIAGRLEQEYPVNTGHGVNLFHLFDETVGNIRPALIVLLAAVGFVLLIACANVASLLLSRAAARRKEMAIRAALGASRMRLIRLMLAESLLLAAAGGAAGLLVAVWGVDGLIAISPADTPRLDEIRIDSRVLIFTSAVTLLTGIVFGLIPALQASRTEMTDSLKEGGRALGPIRNRARSFLVISEVALSLLLLVGAGLTINSFIRLSSLDPGFDSDNVLTMMLNLPGSKYREPHQQVAFMQRVTSDLGEIPGIESTGLVIILPFGGGSGSRYFQIEGRPPQPPGQGLNANFNLSGPGYFRTLGIPLLRGRDFTDQDTRDKPEVAIINAEMARQFWPDEDPLGKRIRIGDSPWRTIIGVVGDTRQSKLDVGPRQEMFYPMLQSPSLFMTLTVRTSGEPKEYISAVRDRVMSLDADLPLYSIRTMNERLAESVAPQRFTLLLMSIFAIVAIALAAIGIYGVMSYNIAQRTHEIGIRMAIGAKTSDVLKMFVRQGMVLAASGMAIGLGAALALTRLMTSLLYGVSVRDPLTFFIVILLLAIVALAACYIPARRAMKVDPMVALRYE